MSFFSEYPPLPQLRKVLTLMRCCSELSSGLHQISGAVRGGEGRGSGVEWSGGEGRGEVVVEVLIKNSSEKLKESINFFSTDSKQLKGKLEHSVN